MRRLDFKLIIVASLLAGVAEIGGAAVEGVERGGTNRLVLLPPTPPPPRPPTDLFRKLLAASPDERNAMLASRTPEGRAFLLNKVHQYEAMPPDRRESHLRALELRWHLNPLLLMGPTNRAWRLAELSEADRKLIEGRLKHWDRLPAELQREILDNESAIRLLVPSEYAGPGALNFMTNLPPQQQQSMRADIARWFALPREKQQSIYANYCQLFAVTKLPPTSSPPLEKALQEFEKIPRAEQTTIIENFRKFTELPQVEREEFLKKAARWQVMSDAEKRAFREQARRRLPLPPMPPGFNPPLQAQAASYSTNK